MDRVPPLRGRGGERLTQEVQTVSETVKGADAMPLATNGPMPIRFPETATEATDGEQLCATMAGLSRAIS